MTVPQQIGAGPRHATAAALAMPLQAALPMFLAFAFGYFFSALVRGVTATLAPTFSAELGLNAADLGLLAGAYFFGFAVMQLPMGSALDRYGARRVLLALTTLAVAGCVAFALARDFATLTLARALIGVGVSACLMAPMTAYRQRLDPTAQMRANSWMLMTGSLGMVASTLPVQWLLPSIGWRGLFWGLAAAFVLAMVGIRWLAPRERPAETGPAADDGGYRAVFRHPAFRRYAPLAFFQYGGMIAVQSLWVGPWLVQVGGQSAPQAAAGLFGVNVAMLFAFMAWGAVVPRLHAAGWPEQRLIAWGMPINISVLVVGCWLGPSAGAGLWALYCASSTVVSLSQPAVGLAFAPALAGRALSAYNLVIFAGVFALQWGMGLAIDIYRSWGASTLWAYRGAFALLGCGCLAAYLWFLRSGRDRRLAAVSSH
jgi:predicted MFS family arabinose efflux permease